MVFLSRKFFIRLTAGEWLVFEEHRQSCTCMASSVASSVLLKQACIEVITSCRRESNELCVHVVLQHVSTLVACLESQFDLSSTERIPCLHSNRLDISNAKSAIEDLRIERHPEFSSVSLCSDTGLTIDVAMYLGVCTCTCILSRITNPPSQFYLPNNLECVLLRNRAFCSMSADELDLILASVWQNSRTLDWSSKELKEMLALAQLRISELLIGHVYNKETLLDYTIRRVKWACSIARLKCTIIRQAQWTR
jgi:hypothetical protein